MLWQTLGDPQQASLCVRLVTVLFIITYKYKPLVPKVFCFLFYHRILEKENMWVRTKEAYSLVPHNYNTFRNNRPSSEHFFEVWCRLCTKLPTKVNGKDFHSKQISLFFSKQAVSFCRKRDIGQKSRPIYPDSDPFLRLRTRSSFLNSSVTRVSHLTAPGSSEERPWHTLVSCLPESGRWQLNYRRDGWPSRKFVYT